MLCRQRRVSYAISRQLFKTFADGFLRQVKLDFFEFAVFAKYYEEKRPVRSVAHGGFSLPTSTQQREASLNQKLS